MDFRYEPRADHLLAVASGSFSAERCREAVIEIKRLCQESRLASVLIDFRGVTDIVSIADRYDLAKFLADSKFAGRVAILVTPPQRFTGTFENTAVNRGANVRTTASEADARAFLGIR